MPRFQLDSSRQRLCVLLGVSVLLFVRSPGTNFIYDEQEALLGSEFLLSETPWWRVLQFDFWGRPPSRTIGSYRPLVTLAYKSLSFSLAWHTPWFLSWLNLVAHGVVAWCVGNVVGEELRDRPSSVRHGAAWASSLAFCCAAICTEAVCSVVGLADVLMTAFLVFGLRLMQRGTTGRAPRSRSARWVFLTSLCLLAWCSKETAISSVLIFPPAAWLFFASRRRGRRVVELVSSGLAAITGAAVAVTVRVLAYPTRVEPPDSWVPDLPLLSGLFSLLRLPPLPADPMNNPLLDASLAGRWATAARLFLEQMAQILVPARLVGDYSFPAQPVTTKAGFLVGALALLSLLLLGLWVALRAVARRSSLAKLRTVSSTISSTASVKTGEPCEVAPARLAALGLLVVLGGYAPLAQVVTLLPTVRAERLLYLPAVGVVWLGSGVVLALRDWWAQRRVGTALAIRFVPRFLPWGRNLEILSLLLTTAISVQAVRARVSAQRYRDDVAFWRATSRAQPSSAKSHLNYGLMLGARGDEHARLDETRRAVQLAPTWPMGRLYLADTHCRRGEIEAASPHYLWALSRLADSKALTALALQCLYDAGGYPRLRTELHRLAAAHEGSWLDYLLYELEHNGESNDGLPPRYRPRGYNVRVGAQSPRR